MRARQVVVSCLVGAIGLTALPPSACALPSATSAVALLPAASPASNVSASYLAPSLQRLRSEVNARWPGRSRASDGWLGDKYHQAKRSDHNSVGHPNGPSFGTPGAVHAIDVTASGIDVAALLAAVVGDSRIAYVIHNSTIWSRTTNWAPRPYTGDRHTTHVHVSLRADSQSAAVQAEQNTSQWLRAKAGASGSVALSAEQVRALQRALIARGFSIPAGATGTFGSQTKAAVAAFQRSQGWRGSGADGLPGPQTLSRLGVLATASSASPAPARSAAVPAVSVSMYQPGATGAHIAALQRALIARGYSISDGATGRFGAQTRNAVAAFQRAQGWRGSGADGIPGAKTLALLQVTGGGATAASSAARPSAAAPSAATSSRYVPGASGEHIKWLQRALLKNGVSVPSGATGWFGPETQRAVAAFQRAQGWSGSQADGVPGPKTLGRLGLK